MDQAYPNGQIFGKNTDFWFENSIRLCRSFQKVKKAFFVIFWRLFLSQCSLAHWLRRYMEISMFLFPCYLRKGTWKISMYLLAYVCKGALMTCSFPERTINSFPCINFPFICRKHNYTNHFWKELCPVYYILPDKTKTESRLEGIMLWIPNFMRHLPAGKCS